MGASGPVIELMKPILTVSAIVTAGTIHITANINIIAFFIIVPPVSVE
jgi:hypothetical protein